MFPANPFVPSEVEGRAADAARSVSTSRDTDGYQNAGLIGPPHSPR